MKATLEFNLPEEESDFKWALNGMHWRNVVTEMDEFLRRRMKYETLPDEQYTAIELCRTELRDLVNAEGLSIED